MNSLSITVLDNMGINQSYTYECHNHHRAAFIISLTFDLCSEQGFTIVDVVMA